MKKKEIGKGASSIWYDSYFSFLSPYSNFSYNFWCSYSLALEANLIYSNLESLLLVAVLYIGYLWIGGVAEVETQL